MMRRPSGASSRTAEAADWHVQLKPASDAALALAMMHVMVRDDLTGQAAVLASAFTFESSGGGGGCGSLALGLPRGPTRPEEVLAALLGLGLAFVAQALRTRHLRRALR